MLLCACMGSYVFNWMNFKNVSAYIFLPLCTVVNTIGQNWTTIGQMDRIGQNWTQIGQISDRIGQKWTIFVQNGQILEKWTNLDNSGQNLVNP